MLPKDPTKIEAYRKLRSQQAIVHDLGRFGRARKGIVGTGKNIAGQTFNKLTAIKFIENKKGGHAFWLFKCDCGKEKIIAASNVTTNRTKSCGCLIGTTKIHGMSNHSKNIDTLSLKFYNTWVGMKARCKYQYLDSAERYVKRGIKVCKSWQLFLNFKKDMYESYLEHINKYGINETSIDRINNDGNYEPSNCKWSTWKEQNNNRTDYSEKSSIAQKERFKHEVPWNKGLKVFKPSDPNKSITKPCLWCNKDFTSLKCHKRKCCCKSCSAKYVGKRDGAWNKGLTLRKESVII